MGNKKILFIQGFSLTQMGGGAEILKKLISYSESYNYKASVAVDLNELPHDFVEKSYNANELHFKSMSKKGKWGIGRIKGIMSTLGLDFKGKREVKGLLKLMQPDVIHLTAHGIGFPFYFMSALAFKRAKIVVSVHDLWNLTVRQYIPGFISKVVFSNILRKVDQCFVISMEMANYLEETYKIKNSIIIHDGFKIMEFQGFNIPNKFTTNFIYIGLLHPAQYKVLYQIMDAMTFFKEFNFTIGICSNTTLEKKQNHLNIEVINYGWVDELQLKEISKYYGFGLLPLSFKKEDLVFYKTSLMTKIPFYFRMGLPVICVGPSESSAIKTIKREKGGICIELDNESELIKNLKKILHMERTEFEQLIRNVDDSIRGTFNSDIISKRFYNSL